MRDLLAEGIVRLLRRSRGFRLSTSLSITSKLVVGLVGLRTLVLHGMRSKRVGRRLLGLLLRSRGQAWGLLWCWNRLLLLSFRLRRSLARDRRQGCAGLRNR